MPRTADDVSGAVEAKLDKVARGENRRVPVVADEDQSLVLGVLAPVLLYRLRRPEWRAG